ncbi:hypothetical protein FJZ21_00070 [Candidatus Pacearchaeota archaeon]|nr:hypothetical protein [Candidatus Pacearchaeota archaeon]
MKYFIALEPERKVYEKIMDHKETVFNLVGDQKFLSHSPHTTLVLLNLDDYGEKIILEKISSFVSKTKKINSEIKGMHVFYNDIQTGGNTITYNFSSFATKNLKNLQVEFLDSLNISDKMKFFSSESDVFKKSGQIEKDNIIKYGFPFVGENWIPHLSLASIDQKVFDLVHKTILGQNLAGQFVFDSIVLYKEENKPQIIKKFTFENV